MEYPVRPNSPVIDPAYPVDMWINATPGVHAPKYMAVSREAAIAWATEYGFDFSRPWVTTIEVHLTERNQYRYADLQTLYIKRSGA